MSKRFNIGYLHLHQSPTICILSHLFCLRKWVFPLLSVTAMGYHTYQSSCYCLPEEVDILRCASPTWLLFDNLASRQATDKHMGIHKTPFSTSFEPIFDPFFQGFCVKPQSERVESASFTLNLLIYDISHFSGVSTWRKEKKPTNIGWKESQEDEF